MVNNNSRLIRLVNQPEGPPSTEDFECVEVEIPDPEQGEVLVKILYLKIGGGHRIHFGDNHMPEGFVPTMEVGEPIIIGAAVGEVIESNADEFDVGDIVKGHALGWTEHAIATPNNLHKVNPDMDKPAVLSVLGLPGFTAFFGILDIVEPRPGDTIVVSAAAGSVGSVAVQIARLAGSHVVGIAGSDKKTDWLTKELGIDDAINYKKTNDMHSAIETACPNGVDGYFDNVGGTITDAVIDNLNVRARVAACGQVSLYNKTETPMGPRRLGIITAKRAKIEGFFIPDYEQRYGEARERLRRWVTNGDIQYRHTMIEGIENIPRAFAGVYDGDNIGQQLVKVADE